MEAEKPDSQSVPETDAIAPTIGLPQEAKEASGDEGTREPIDPTADPAYWRNTRVLLLDDDQEDGQLVIAALKEIGVRKIIWVKFASRAYYQLVEDKEVFPDILVLELVLAGTSGLSLLARLRSSGDEAMCKLPAVVITANNNPNIFRRATNQKVSAFLRKPVSTPRLREALERARTGHVIEMPLDFGRSWIDDVEDTQDKAEVLPPPSFLQRLLSFFGKPKNIGVDLEA